jgi:hypothetical protein
MYKRRPFRIRPLLPSPESDYTDGLAISTDVEKAKHMVSDRHVRGTGSARSVPVVYVLALCCCSLTTGDAHETIIIISQRIGRDWEGATGEQYRV